MVLDLFVQKITILTEIYTCTVIIQKDKLNKWIIIDNDLEVEIETLNQSETYESVEFGYPIEHRNNWLISYILQRVHKPNNPQSFYLIQPQPILMDADIEKYKSPLEIPKEIPNTECHIRVSTKKIANDTNQSDSTMLIIWFQDKLAFPIDPNILEKIKVIPYRKLCFYRDPIKSLL